MKPRDVVPLVLAFAALVAFALFLYSAHASDQAKGDVGRYQAHSMRAGIAIAAAVCLWLACITSGFTASEGFRKKLLIWSGLVAPLVCAAAYVVLLIV